MHFNEAYIAFFGPDHWVYLIGFFAALTLLIASRERIRARRDRVDRLLAGVIVFQQILLYGTYIFYYGFDLAEALPLHICRITSLVILAYLVTKRRRYYVIGTAFGLFALLSFIYPSQVVAITHPMGLSFFISHTVNLLFGLYGYLTRGLTITPRDVVRAVKAFVLYFFAAYLFNPLVGGNYFYFRDKPLVGAMPDPVYVPLCLMASVSLIVLGMGVYMALEGRARGRKRALSWPHNLSGQW